MRQGRGCRYRQHSDRNERLDTSVDNGTAALASTFTLGGSVGADLICFRVAVLAAALDQDMSL